MADSGRVSGILRWDGSDTPPGEPSIEGLAKALEAAVQPSAGGDGHGKESPVVLELGEARPSSDRPGWFEIAYAIEGVPAGVPVDPGLTGTGAWSEGRFLRSDAASGPVTIEPGGEVKGVDFEYAVLPSGLLESLSQSPSIAEKG